MSQTDRSAEAPDARTPISLIVAWCGTGDEPGLLAGIAGLQRADGDEVILVDAVPGGGWRDAPGVRIVRGGEGCCSYYAWNAGAEAARNDWLVFIDPDCTPAPDLLEAYVRSPIEPDVGAVGGTIEAAGDDLLARYANARGLLDQTATLLDPRRSAAVTANLLVRRRAWESVGGFHEGIRSRGDAELGRRLREAGWRLERRPEAIVRCRTPRRLRDLARQIAAHGAGAAWLNRRYPGSSPRAPLGRALMRSAAGIVGWTLRGRPERASFAALDAVACAAAGFGHVAGSNAAPGTRPRRGDHELVVLVDSFPRLSETFVVGEAKALRRQGYRIRVEAISRPPRPLRGGARGLTVSYREDDSLLARLSCFAALAATRPLRCARDALAQPRWRRGGDHVTRLASLAVVARRVKRGGERHLHAHFATTAALEAMRLSSLVGRPYSVAPHAYDIFARPASLEEKLTKASFVVTACEYNVDYLRRMLGSEHADRIHEVVLGVDESRFRRASELRGGRAVGAVGRLVEKKGFSFLIEAIATLVREGGGVDWLAIAGDGPLRDELEAQAERRGVADRVRFVGAVEPDGVLELLERIDVFAMPCVIAADGDRDSMPVVVKEALAMEVPVVASDLVGLPEVVRPQWGRLVPPGDPAALARALDELLALPLEARAEMGARGRAHVLERCNVDVEARKLARLAGLSRSG